MEDVLETLLRLTAEQDQHIASQFADLPFSSSPSTVHVHGNTNTRGIEIDSAVLDKMDERYELLKRAVAAFSKFADQKGLENRAGRNHLTRAYRIPTEVYIQIFEWLRCHSRFRIKDAMNVSHVSRLWRDIALETPSLWTLIQPIRKELIETFLTRSKTAPLEIAFWIKYEIESESFVERVLSDFLAPLLPHISRWESLSMNQVAPRFLAPHLVSPAPQLRALTLSKRGWHRHHSLDIFRPMLFGGSAPCLRELSLAGAFILLSPQNLPLYSGLTKLHFRHVAFSEDLLSDLLLTLNSSFLLEELHFYWKFLDLWIDSEDMLQISSPLPSLREIVIKGTVAPVVRYILNSVRPPSSVRLEISTTLEDHEDVRSVLPSCSDVMNTLPSLSNIDHLLFLGTSDPCKEILSLHGKVGAAQLLTIDFTMHPDTESTYADTCGNVLRSIGGAQTYFPSLKGLTFRDITTRQLQPRRLTQVFANMPRVDQLAFRSCSQSLVKALTIKISQNLFPHMTSLHIHRSFITAKVLINLVRSRANVDDGARVNSWTNLDLGKSNPKATRPDSWARLDTLVLSRCDEIDASAVATLKELVRDVQWDGSRHIGSIAKWSKTPSARGSNEP
ncbi:hypothetical protein BOTBODRAFT_178322 [Botryobasidium botryosum FD-172 SS1]|uniref:F-box domain-containing protein n=1 Tax=Botryobasidium botryosum (strain FD-172 SS1) TaxID=930990 RepID=A0A067MFE0_BOTB1|nr:hypothetical protein BOTBODRAFT_178322 [Botryobasidium botryosum FD-172 SS1]